MLLPAIVAALLAYNTLHTAPQAGTFAIVSQSEGAFVRMDTRDARLELCTFVGTEFSCKPIDEKEKI